MNAALGGSARGGVRRRRQPGRAPRPAAAMLPPQPASRRELVLLSRNFGSFAAIRVGLADATGQYFAVMAADLQEPPELALEFFRALAADECDVVIGTRARTRRSAAEPARRRRCSGALYRRLVDAATCPPAASTCSAATARSATPCWPARKSNTLARRAAVLARLPPQAEVPYARRARLHGKSGWTFRKKVTYLMDSVFAFTDLPIRLLIAFGMIGLLVSTVARSGGARRAARRPARRARLRGDRPGGAVLRRHSTRSASASSAPTSGAPTRTPSAGRWLHRRLRGCEHRRHGGIEPE